MKRNECRRVLAQEARAQATHGKEETYPDEGSLACACDTLDLMQEGSSSVLFLQALANSRQTYLR